MKLTYDLFKINYQGNELYFVYDNELHLVVTKGVDYFSAWYLLMFKLRPFAENFNEYISFFEEKKFDLHNKNFFNNALLGNLMDEIASYSTSCFMTRDELIFDAPAYGLSEIDYLEKIAILKPNKHILENYRNQDAEIEIALRYVQRKTVFEELKRKFFDAVDDQWLGLTEEKVEIDSLFTLKEICTLISGGNGDLWLGLYKSYPFPKGFDANEFLYRNQAKAILNNSEHIKNTHYVLVAMDSLKDNYEEFCSFYEALPKEVKQQSIISKFYSWHL